VRKTSVYLSEVERRRLADLARLEGVPQAQVIREAIIAYEGRRTVDREFRLQAIAEGPGGSIADVPDEELLTGFGE
jgi:predicted transcriptional regulator